MSKQNQHFFILIVLCLLGLSFVSCSSLSEMGHITATESDRVEQLGLRLEKYARGISWASPQDAMIFAAPDVRVKLGRELGQRFAKERPVEVTVGNVDFAPGANTATATMEITYFKKPTSYMRRRTEKQTWTYMRYEGGWMIKDFVVEEDGLVTTGTPAGSAKNRGRLSPQ